MLGLTISGHRKPQRWQRKAPETNASPLQALTANARSWAMATNRRSLSPSPTTPMSRLSDALKLARRHAKSGNAGACERALDRAYQAHLDHLDAIAQAHGYSDDVSEAELAERDAATDSFDAATLEIEALLSGGAQ